MAKKVAGHIFFIGRMDPIQVYMSCGKCIIRTVSSLTGKRVKTDPKFHRTMQNAALLGRASRIASFVYGELPKTFRQFWMYRAFTGEAIQLLRQGKSDKEASAALWKTYAEIWVIKKEQAQDSIKKQEKRDNVKRNKISGIPSMNSIVSLYGRLKKSTVKKRNKRYLPAAIQKAGKKIPLRSNCLPP